MKTERELAGMAILEKSGALLTELERGGELTAQDLAEALHEPVSSTYRLLASLTAIGWVDHGSRKRTYRLGIRLLEIGHLLESGLNVRDACRPAMERLRAATGATVFLCFRRGDAAVCVERLDGPDVRSLAMRLGDALPLYRGAAPVAAFAWLPPDERDTLLKHFEDLRRGGQDLPTSEKIDARLAHVRAQGYSVSDEDVTPGVAAIGVPVRNHRGEVEGALSASGLRGRILDPTGDVVALTMRAAAEASAALGYRGEAAE